MLRDRQALIHRVVKMVVANISENNYKLSLSLVNC